MSDAKQILSDLDLGGWAEHYAKERGFYGHFKDEIYPVFCAILSGLPKGARVLDIGAGPGNLAVEFYKRYPKSGVSFLLVDASRELLRIATERLAARPVATLVRSFNMDDWDEGIGLVDAIVSNNALFHVRPERLEDFYSACLFHLRPEGMLLNQQAFGYADGETPYGDAAFPSRMKQLLESLFPGMPQIPKEELKRLEEEKERAKERHKQALAEAKAAGVEVAKRQSGYHFLSVETHLAALRVAGFAAGCIWRKREFALVCGIKIA